VRPDVRAFRLASALVSIGQKGTIVLQIASLSKFYGEQRALEDVGFSVQEGEVFGLIGPNGAGKTTLLEAIAGLLPVDSGEIRFRDQVLPLGRRREVIFYLPDGVRPYGDQTTGQVVAFFAGVYRRSTTEASEIVSMVGLRPVLTKRIHALSKGYNRRLILALGFLTRHPILLMDEPFDGFDLRQTRDMMGILGRAASGGRTLLLSIHQLRDAEQVCDRFALLADGRIRGVGVLDELRGRANCPGASLEDVFLALT
jgi:ABC-2 type transport system ATP-binding protein